MKPENLFPDGIKNNVRRNRSVRITKRQTKNLNHVRFIQAPSKLSTRIDTGTKDKYQYLFLLLKLLGPLSCFFFSFPPLEDSLQFNNSYVD